jgi:hypothetical protein
VWSEVDAPDCDAWENALSESQANVAAAQAKAAARMPQRDQELLTRQQRHQTFLHWYDIQQIQQANSFFA